MRVQRLTALLALLVPLLAGPLIGAPSARAAEACFAVTGSGFPLSGPSPPPGQQPQGFC